MRLWSLRDGDEEADNEEFPLAHASGKDWESVTVTSRLLIPPTQQQQQSRQRQAPQPLPPDACRFPDEGRAPPTPSAAFAVVFFASLAPSHPSHLHACSVS